MQDIQVHKSAEKCVKHRINTYIAEEVSNIRESSYNSNEKCEQIEVLLTIKQVVDNYDELKPVITEFLEKEREEK